jgi:hypothetical protein
MQTDPVVDSLVWIFGSIISGLTVMGIILAIEYLEQKALNHRWTLGWRLRKQDYLAKYCSIAIVNEAAGTTDYIVEFVGQRFGDSVKFRVRGKKPIMNYPSHLVLVSEERKIEARVLIEPRWFDLDEIPDDPGKITVIEED